MYPAGWRWRNIVLMFTWVPNTFHQNLIQITDGPFLGHFIWNDANVNTLPKMYQIPTIDLVYKKFNRLRTTIEWHKLNNVLKLANRSFQTRGSCCSFFSQFNSQVTNRSRHRPTKARKSHENPGRRPDDDCPRIRAFREHVRPLHVSVRWLPRRVVIVTVRRRSYVAR